MSLMFGSIAIKSFIKYGLVFLQKLTEHLIQGKDANDDVKVIQTMIFHVCNRKVKPGLLEVGQKLWIMDSASGKNLQIMVA